MRNKYNIQHLAREYFNDRLGLRNTEYDYITFSMFDNRGYLGSASGQWTKSGLLLGKLSVEVKRMMDLRGQLSVLAHELVHIKQYVDGRVKFTNGNNRLYSGQPDHYQYSKRSTEREANKTADRLVNNFILQHYTEFNILCKLNIFVYKLVSGKLNEL